jgi:hypothetical protein
MNIGSLQERNCHCKKRCAVDQPEIFKAMSEKKIYVCMISRTVDVLITWAICAAVYYHETSKYFAYARGGFKNKICTVQKQYFQRLPRFLGQPH